MLAREVVQGQRMPFQAAMSNGGDGHEQAKRAFELILR